MAEAFQAGPLGVRAMLPAMGCHGMPWEDEYGNSARHALHRFASVQRPQEVRNCARPQKYTVYAVYHYIII